jgi:acyl-coenzyme A thioesterase PaaI-like protein
MGIIMANKFSTIIKKANKAPPFLRSFLLTKLFSSKVKFAGTTGIAIQKVSHHEVIIRLKNKTKVQNHIGGIHAVAAAVLAESATGIVFGMNVPDSKLPLLKTMKIDYQRRMQGSLQAIARLTDTQISSIDDDEKGSIIVPVTITDESEQTPIECHMEWAWVRKRS